MLELIILIFLIILNGLCVMAEISLVSARKSRLENLASEGDELARSALKLVERPELFLSTAQIFITLIAILTGFYSGEKFSADLQPYLERIPYLRHYAANISTGLILVFVTLASIIVAFLLFGMLQGVNSAFSEATKGAKGSPDHEGFFAKVAAFFEGGRS